jgi:hypothetical protein
MRKSLNFARTILITLSILFIVSSCKKQDIQPQFFNQNLTQVSSDDEVSFSKEGENTRLTLRPGPGKSQDVYVGQRDGIDLGSESWVPELTIDAWTDGGDPLFCSAYIRFDSLSKIPVSSTVKSAKLYLYTPPTSISTPQGNSGDNACYVRAVASAWDESTLTYNNQPGYSTLVQSILQASNSQWNYTAVTDVTKLVRYFVARPDRNFGFNITLVTPEKYRSYIFGSSEQEDKNLRPKLVVVYQ